MAAQMHMNVRLANPFLIFIYSVILLMLGCAIGIHWRAHPGTALLLAVGGAVLMVIHDLGMGFLWFLITAKMYVKRQQLGK